MLISLPRCRATSVTFADLIIKGCKFNRKQEDRSLIEVSPCEDQNVSGHVVLDRVTLSTNTLNPASGLPMSESSCSDLEMVDVEIEDNEVELGGYHSL